MERKIKVLLAKIGLDGHNVGVIFLSMELRREGMEVIYLGQYLTAEKVVAAAIDEDVDVIGLSFLSGSHLEHTSRVLDLLRERGANIPVIVGGVIPRPDMAPLKERGVKEVFEPGSTVSSIANCIKELVLSSDKAGSTREDKNGL